MIGTVPSKIKKINEKLFELVMHSMVECEKLKSLNGKNIAGRPQKIEFEQVICTLDTAEIFLLVNQKLSLRDRQDLLQNFRETPNRRMRSLSLDTKPKGDSERGQSPIPSPRSEKNFKGAKRGQQKGKPQPPSQGRGSPVPFAGDNQIQKEKPEEKQSKDMPPPTAQASGKGQTTGKGGGRQDWNYSWQGKGNSWQGKNG
jgi:hypothetical protein